MLKNLAHLVVTECHCSAFLTREIILESRLEVVVKQQFENSQAAHLIHVIYMYAATYIANSKWMQGRKITKGNCFSSLIIIKFQHNFFRMKLAITT